MSDRISIEDYRLLQEGKGKQSKAQKPKTDYKQIFLQQIKVAKLPMPELEVKFHASRKWRLDFAWEKEMIAIEYHGIFGAHKAGHQAVKSLQRDYEKANEAVLLGWLYLTITAETVDSGQALTWLEKALTQRNKGKL